MGPFALWTLSCLLRSLFTLPLTSLFSTWYHLHHSFCLSQTKIKGRVVPHLLQLLLNFSSLLLSKASWKRYLSSWFLLSHRYNTVWVVFSRPTSPRWPLGDAFLTATDITQTQTKTSTKGWHLLASVNDSPLPLPVLHFTVYMALRYLKWRGSLLITTAVHSFSFSTEILWILNIIVRVLAISGNLKDFCSLWHSLKLGLISSGQ